jgi:FtsP/CotA-like multicopper oxidase with cupredoxin domain
MLGGSMQPYVWTISGAVWGQHRPITARSGERVVLSFHNMSKTGHPARRGQDGDVRRS